MEPKIERLCRVVWNLFGTEFSECKQKQLPTESKIYMGIVEIVLHSVYGSNDFDLWLIGIYSGSLHETGLTQLTEVNKQKH